MHDWRRIGGLAVVLLVLLRMSIGWQLLYEGLWKIDTQDTSDPWTAEGYLENARGPLRPYFQWLGGDDPYDLNWLDYDRVSERWDRWQKRFVRHYGLDEEQQRRLNILLNGPEIFGVRLQQWPEEIELGGSLAKAVTYKAEHNRLQSPGDWHITPDEHKALLGLANKIDDPDLAQEYRDAVDRLYRRARNLSYKERLLVSLKGDPERAGLILEEFDEKRPGQIDRYKQRIAEYERKLAAARVDFHHAHLQKKFEDLQQMRAELVGPVKGMEQSLKEEARELLTAEQFAKGPVPESWSRIDYVDFATMWGLTVLGGLLIAGLLTRISAFLAAGMVLSFYLAMPPWPGVPQPPGPEHSLIVNKNLIEVVALLALMALPTGKWFGVDAVFRRNAKHETRNPK